MPRPAVVAAGLGVGAGAVSTWFHISHGVVCIPTMVLPPLNLLPQVAAGSTCVGVAARQSLGMYFQSLYAGVDGRPPIEDIIDVHVAFFSGISSAIAAWKAAGWTSIASRKTLLRCNGLGLIAVSMILPFRNKLRDAEMEVMKRPPIEFPEHFDPTRVGMRNVAELIALGFLSGSVLGVTGVGTAWALTPALMYLGYKTKFEEAQTTAMASTMPATLAAAIRHYRLGHLSYLTWPLMAGAIFGGYAGAEITPFEPEEPETFGLIAFAFIFGCHAIIRA